MSVFFNPVAHKETQRVPVVSPCNWVLAPVQYQPGYANGGIPAPAAQPRPKINPEQVRHDSFISDDHFPGYSANVFGRL